MNIISKNSLAIILIALLIIFLPNTVFSGSSQDTSYALSFTLSGGISINDDASRFPVERIGITPTLKLMWHPENLLNIGFMTSYLFISSTNNEFIETKFGNTDFRASLRAIPILLLFNMEVWKLEVNGGLGVAKVNSKLEAFDTQVNSSEWNNIFYYGICYYYDINNLLSLGIEANSYILSKHDKFIAGFLVNLRYKFHNW